MQQDIAPSDASTRAPGWYLRRDDQEYGPLTDRELAMLAERGGVKTEDRLWKPGFVSWKPIHDIAELDRGQRRDADAPSPRSSQVAVVPQAPILTPEPPSRAQRIKEVAAGGAEELHRHLRLSLDRVHGVPHP